MKYRLTDEKREYNGRTLYRIICVKAFGEVKEGELGGWIGKEGNLSQSGNAWVYGNAKVSGNAWVCENAKVSDDAFVGENAKVSGNAEVSGNVFVSGCAAVCADACVGDHAAICGYAFVGGDACVKDNAVVCDYAQVVGNAQIGDWVHIVGYAHIGGNVCIFGDARIGGNAQVCERKDFIVFKNHFSSGRYFTWTRSDNMWSVGCFRGTGEELIAKAYQDNEAKGRFYEAYVDFVQRLEILEEEMEKSLQ